MKKRRLTKFGKFCVILITVCLLFTVFWFLRPVFSAQPSAAAEVTAEPTVEPTTEPSTGGPSATSTTKPTVAPSTGGSSATSTTKPGKDMPNTGAAVGGLVMAGMVMVAAGVLLVARRRAED